MIHWHSRLSKYFENLERRDLWTEDENEQHTNCDEAVSYELDELQNLPATFCSLGYVVLKLGKIIYFRKACPSSIENFIDIEVKKTVTRLNSEK